MMEVESSLLEGEFMKLPSVYVRPDVDRATATRIREIIVTHQGEICGNIYFLNYSIGYIEEDLNFIYIYVEEEDEATHVIYPPADPLEEEFARPVIRRGRQVLLHWYYLPDSHDSWVALDLPVSSLGIYVF